MPADERGLARRITQFLAVADQLREDLGPAAVRPHPMHWPSLSAEDQTKELDDLRAWVDQLAVRFPLLVKLPTCWSQHNDLVEVLASLRDAERGCYAETAPLAAAAEWHRILRETEARLDHWIKRLRCGVAARGHVTGRTADPEVSPTRTPRDEAATPDAGRTPGG